MAPKQRRGLELVNWRQLELEQFGFPRSLAARIARDKRYDLDSLIGLVQQGCSPALAVRILSPLEPRGAEASVPKSPG